MLQVGKAHLALGKAYQSAGPELIDKAEAALQRACDICVALRGAEPASKAQVSSPSPWVPPHSVALPALLRAALQCSHSLPGRHKPGGLLEAVPLAVCSLPEACTSGCAGGA